MEPEFGEPTICCKAIELGRYAAATSKLRAPGASTVSGSEQKGLNGPAFAKNRGQIMIHRMDGDFRLCMEVRSMYQMVVGKLVECNPY